MNYFKINYKNPNFTDVNIESVFITEFMPDAPGDFVKVYLYAKALADREESLSPGEMAAVLELSENRVLEAWDHWESVGAVKKRYIDGEGKLDFAVEFISLKEQLLSRPASIPADAPKKVVEGKPTHQAFGSEAVKELTGNIEKKLGRPLNVNELRKIISWVDDMGANPEVILQAVVYCAEKGKSNFNYITTVLEGWIGQGISSVDEAKNYIEEFDQRFVRHRRVMQALGQTRNATEEERRIMDVWFDEMGYNMERVLEACGRTAGINNPNIKYVDKVLSNWKNEAIKENRDVNKAKKVSNAALRDYYEYLREKADREAEERKAEVYARVPEIKKIDEEIQECGIKLVQAVSARDNTEGTRLNQELERLNEDKLFYLVENNFSVNYMDTKYLCTRCNDTGIAEMGGPCDCMEKRRVEAEVWLEKRGEN